jgi:hypothetical protein
MYPPCCTISLHTHACFILVIPCTYACFMLSSPRLPPKVLKNINCTDFNRVYGLWGFPNHFTPCSPSPNQINIFFSYKK